MLDGFQLLNTSAEKSVSEEQFNHVESIVIATGIETSNEGSDEHPSNAKRKSVTKGRAVSKLVRDVHIRQAAKALVADEISELKLVRAVQFCHVRNNLVAVGSGVLNEVSPLPCHALSKFTLDAAVPSFAPSGNDVSDEQYLHAPEKLVPLLIFSAGKLFSDTQLYHVSIKEEPAEVFSNGKLVRLWLLPHA